MKKNLFLVLGLLILITTVVRAASLYQVWCTDKNCGYKGNLALGGLFSVDEVTGYCAHDKEFVSLKWKRGFKGPQPLTVWNPETGKTLALYKCPKCDDLFVPLKSIQQLKFCPQCNKATIEHRHDGYKD